MKQKSATLRNLERNRYSILATDLENCYFCGRSPVDMHEIYGGRNRRVSMQNGFCVPLCRRHHENITNNEQLSLLLKKDCQESFEATHSRDEFMKLIGKNYRE